MIVRSRHKVVVKLFATFQFQPIYYNRIFWVDDYLLYCIKQVTPSRFDVFIRESFPDSRKTSTFYRYMSHFLDWNWKILDVIC